MSLLNQMLQSPSPFVFFLYLILAFLIIRFSTHAYSRVSTPEIEYAPVRELRFVNKSIHQSYGRNIYGSSSSRIPKILVWTPSITPSNYSSTKFMEILQRHIRACPYHCELDQRPNIEESEADAILIHSRTINPSDLPRERRSEQVYVWMCHEEPGKCGKGDRSLPSNYFNTSMTNIRDTIGYNYGYGEIVKTNNVTVLNRISDEKWSRIMSKKSDLGIAIISNCHTDSKREVYIERLSKIVNFTLRGSCYSDVELCPKSRKDSWDCVTKLFESYYFYFAFENTVCRDYVTEKFFHRLLSNIVPVVLRRQILNGIAPSDSFIAADDFESPEELAAHLLKVASDPQLYRKYFKWRDSYAVGNFHSIEGNGVCALCRDLHAKKVRSYSDYNARQRYSRNLCESDVGWKLLNNRKLE